jgi:hypothetical protein
LSKYKYVNNTKEFVDKGIIQKGDYTYTIKVLLADGAESLPAETISINIQ